MVVAVLAPRKRCGDRNRAVVGRLVAILRLNIVLEILLIICI